MNALSWLCSLGSLTVAGMFAKGLRIPGLWLSLGMQVPWAVMAYLAGQWGVVFASFCFAAIDVWGLRRK